MGGEDRQTLAGAVLRVPAPLDGSGWLAARPRSFEPRRSPWPPTLRGLLSCRSRPWSSPSELSHPGEPHPLSRAVASLRVRIRLPPAQCLRDLHGRFLRFAPALCHASPPEGEPRTHEPGRRSPRSLARSPRCASRRPARTVSLPTCTGLAGRRPARPLRSLAPPGSPFSDGLLAWPG